MAEKTALELQIEAEAKELRDAPVLPQSQWIGSHKRCHLCGQIYSEHDLERFDHHLGGRLRCPNCGGSNG